jgi:saccharopine dehydrogenase-like NADP-dependent oxidoreductase
MKIIVLGGGLIGTPMAVDLAADSGFEVCVADINQSVLENLAPHEGIQTVQMDISDTGALTSRISGFDMVINAVPGFMGFKTLQTIIEAKKNVVDIAFSPEDALTLDGLAQKNGVVAAVDCGVAPGMSNLLTGYAYHQLDECDSAVIYVGGLPLIREWPWEYKAVFSPADVIEEYTRPACFVENGELIWKPALSDPEYITFSSIGTLEAFNTDGLRTMAKTLDIPNMKEKTLRYPGHIEKIAVLRETGFFSTKEMEIDGKTIRPLDVTSRLLFPKWELNQGETDITVMKIIVEGKKDGKQTSLRFDLFDRYDEKAGVHSMARTTGYTATAVTRLMARKLFDRTGVSPLEVIGQKPACVDFILQHLKKRGIKYKKTVAVHPVPNDAH